MLNLRTPWIVFGGSVLLVGGLAALLLWNEKPEQKTLIVLCAPALRQPMEEIRQMYEEGTEHKIVYDFGPSRKILNDLKFASQADLFFPADDSYIRDALGDGLVGDVLPVAQMRAALILGPSFMQPINTWQDLIGAPGRIAQANPEAAAISQMTQAHLKGPKWEALNAKTIAVGDVGEVPSAVRLGREVIGGIVWDAMLVQPACQDLRTARLPELDGVTANVKIAVTARSTKKKEAVDFAFFVANSCRDVWRKHGYGVEGIVPKKPDVPKPGKESDTAESPRIVIYAGAMLQPAIEETIAAFEKREGVKVERVYNGCGILVSQMRAGRVPDAYFACDTSFMTQVADLFEAPKIVSKNQLVMAVPKGNPKGIHSLKDLGKPGLKVGVGHEQQCALGAITRGVLIRGKVYKAVMDNVAVQAPSGDILISQLRVGALDAVITYASYVTLCAEDLDAVRIEEVNCNPAQPVAISRSTARPDVVRRLLKALESAESKGRFEKLGFGWEVTP
jgi:molybdate transport system substrate-binding protein